MAQRWDAHTFFTDFGAGGLKDDRHVVELFRSLANGNIVPAQTDGAKPKGRRKAHSTILPLKAVEVMQSGRDEIVIAMGRAAVLRGPAPDALPLMPMGSTGWQRFRFA